MFLSAQTLSILGHHTTLLRRKGAYEYGGWVLIGLAIYMVLMVLIGWWASKRMKTTTDFRVAGRRLGLFLCTGTLFATWFCSDTAMGGAGNAYLFGNQGVIFDPWGAALCLFIAGLFFAGVPLWLGISISTVILVVYTYLRGMRAVTMTDAA
jgi:Na+/proline symporter